MLARARPGDARRRLVPARRATKDETRAEASERRAGSRRARGEPGGVLPRRRRLPPVPRAARSRADAPARSSTRAGIRLGSHDGHWRYTPGQRRGLGVAAGHPLYAIATHAATNTVVVGPREALARTSLTAVRPPLRAGRARPNVKVRYRSPRRRGARSRSVAGGFRLELDEPAYGVAPGQTAVLYEDDVVVGAGTLVPA